MSLLTVDQAAERLGVSSTSIRRWAAAGRLRMIRVGPKLVRFDPADLDALLVAGSPGEAAAPRAEGGRA